MLDLDASSLGAMVREHTGWVTGVGNHQKRLETENTCDQNTVHH